MGIGEKFDAWPKLFLNIKASYNIQAHQETLLSGAGFFSGASLGYISLWKATNIWLSWKSLWIAVCIEGDIGPKLLRLSRILPAAGITMAQEQ